MRNVSIATGLGYEATLESTVVILGEQSAAALGVPVGTRIDPDDPADRQLFERHQAYVRGLAERGA